MQKSCCLPTIKNEYQSSLNHKNKKTNNKKAILTNSLIVHSRNSIKQIKKPYNQSIQQSAIKKMQSQIPRFTHSKQRTKNLLRYNIYNNLPSMYQIQKMQQNYESQTSRISKLNISIPQQVSQLIKCDKRQANKCLTQQRQKQLILSSQKNEQKQRINQLKKNKQNIILNRVILQQQSEMFKQYEMMFKQITNIDINCSTSLLIQRLERMENNLVDDIKDLQNITLKNSKQIQKVKSRNKILEEQRNYLKNQKNNLISQLQKIDDSINNNKKYHEQSIIDTIQIWFQAIYLFFLNRFAGMENKKIKPWNAY